MIYGIYFIIIKYKDLTSYFINKKRNNYKITFRIILNIIQTLQKILEIWYRLLLPLKTLKELKNPFSGYNYFL